MGKTPAGGLMHGFGTDALGRDDSAQRRRERADCPSARESRPVEPAFEPQFDGSNLPIQLPVSVSKSGGQDATPCATATL